MRIPFFTNEKAAEALQTQAPENFGSAAFRPSETPEAKTAAFRHTKDSLTVNGQLSAMLDSIALRFGGFSANLKALIEPVSRDPSPAIARKFFSEKLESVLSLARRNPAAAILIIKGNSGSSSQIWGLLLRTACGDSRAALSAIDSLEENAGREEVHAIAECTIAIAKFAPLEASHILRRLSAIGDNTARLMILRTFVEQDSIGSKGMVGEVFLDVMSRSAPSERGGIYSALLDILEDTQKRPSSRAAFLKGLLRGWLSESPAGQVSNVLLKRIDNALA
jgi:hypothetical protein